MFRVLENLCLLNGTSGDESRVREYIINEIRNYCDYSVDALGSVIALKKGKKIPDKKVMISAHMDEVGFIITYITEDGYLKFSPVGGIDPRVVIDRVVDINGTKGVIGAKAVHLLSADEKKSAPSFDKMVQKIKRMQKNMFLSVIMLILFLIIRNSATDLLRRKHLMTESAACL